jgi:3,4-dihydroxyphenylacetate 2,3-dioxygenase
MNDGVLACGIVAHVPTLSRAEITPEYQNTLVEGERRLGKQLRALKPDLWVVISTHWVSTFNWFTTLHESHQGICVAEEAPDLIPGIPYEYKGDPEFASALLKEWTGRGIPCQENKTAHYSWDYGTYVPLSHLDPESEIPVVSIPVVLMANLEECLDAGSAIVKIAQRQKKRVVVLASSAFSHALVRGREHWPRDDRLKLDQSVIEQLKRGDIDQVIDGFDDYSKRSVVEMGGRAIATMLGAASSMKQQLPDCSGITFGDYAQSSGSGNVNILLASSQVLDQLK